MLSILPPSGHVSSYATSPSYPATLQPSYEAAEFDYNAVNWHSEGVYPSPPMSSSPTGQFPGQPQRYEPYPAGRYVHHPSAPQGAQQWPQQAAYQGAYSQQHPHQHQHQHQHHLAAVGPSPRSPRGQHIFPAQYSVQQPQPGHANYAYAQPQPHMVHGYPTPEGVYATVQPAQPPTVLGSSAPGPKQQKMQRRTKPHVVTACYNCKKAHLSCEEVRPCQRCKSSGKTDSCFNVAHKRRGRPRIRDGKSGKQGPAAPAINTHTQSKSASALARSGSYGPDSAISFAGVTFDSRGFESPRAFLGPDFQILRANEAFKSHFDYERDPVGRSLEQLIDSSDKNTVNQLRDSLNEEARVKDVSYLAPLRTANGDEPTDVPSVESLDYTSVTAQGFTCRESNLRFRFKGGNVQNLSVNLQLAKTNQYFIVLSLPIMREEATSAITPATASFPQPPRVVPQVNTSSSYAINSSFPMSPQPYSAQAVAGPQHRATNSTASAPPSPYYTLGPVPQPMSATTTSPMTPGRTPYEQQFYYSAGPMYAYTAHGGQQTQAMQAATEPRQFQQYPGEMQYPAGQQVLPPGYQVQLPPIYAQQQPHERPRSVQAPQVAYGIPHEQEGAYAQQMRHAQRQVPVPGHGHGHGAPPRKQSLR